jgi:hypothetical protein
MSGLRFFEHLQEDRRTRGMAQRERGASHSARPHASFPAAKDMPLRRLFSLVNSQVDGIFCTRPVLSR